MLNKAADEHARHDYCTECEDNKHGKNGSKMGAENGALWLRLMYEQALYPGQGIVASRGDVGNVDHLWCTPFLWCIRSCSSCEVQQLVRLPAATSVGRRRRI